MRMENGGGYGHLLWFQMSCEKGGGKENHDITVYPHK